MITTFSSTSPSLAFLMGLSPMELFSHGGPIMWPIAAVSFLALAVVSERTLFLIRETRKRKPEMVAKILEKIEANDADGALALGKKSDDYISRVLVYALEHKEHAPSNAFTRAANHELTRFQQGMATLDTCITAAPLLGLLGTVTGMMATFGALGEADIGASASKITGGVGEALIATSAGLVIAIIGLFPYNILNAHIELAKHSIADASHAFDLIAKKQRQGDESGV